MLPLDDPPLPPVDVSLVPLLPADASDPLPDESNTPPDPLVLDPLPESDDAESLDAEDSEIDPLDFAEP